MIPELGASHYEEDVQVGTTGETHTPVPCGVNVEGLNDASSCLTVNGTVKATTAQRGLDHGTLDMLDI